MKKTLVSALTAALVAGAASTTFAAANPFSDVPADHWAYDAVTQLAKDGVVEGYGDSTYRGGQEITRYEMAQIVAKAMAKEDISKADKALVDKLAAEFSDELNNLGVRVANLEKKTDNVKWTGEMRYTYSSERHDSVKGNNNEMRLRIMPSAVINEHWTAKARMQYNTDMNSSKNAVGGDTDDIFLDRAYVEGVYGDTVIEFGKFPYFTTMDQGMIFDDQISGVQVNFGKTLRTTITAGRFSSDQNGDLNRSGYAPYTYSYQGIEFNYNPGKKFRAGVAYHRFASAEGLHRNSSYHADSAGIWALGMGYTFDKNFALNAAYAKNTQGDVESKHNTAYSIELDYKGADQAKQGSFGIFAAYRHLGGYASVLPTYDAIFTSQKGWELGAAYTLFPNVVGELKYFRGKDLGTTDTDASKLFARVHFYF